VCRTRRWGGIGVTYRVFRGSSAFGDRSHPKPYVPRSNRATDSAGGLVQGIDLRTSLVVSEGPTADWDWCVLIGSLRAHPVRGFTTWVRSRAPEPPENVSSEIQSTTDPRSGRASRRFAPRGGIRRSPFGPNLFGATAAVA
jgi:hypothetical protein